MHRPHDVLRIRLPAQIGYADPFSSFLFEMLRAFLRKEADPGGPGVQAEDYDPCLHRHVDDDQVCHFFLEV